MRLIGIIPARYASTRFPGKPLVQIEGKSMVQRVHEQASVADSLAEVIVATDDQRIHDHVLSFGGKVMMTAADHLSGTDRCAEVVALRTDVDAVINIQGDEPFIHPGQIDQVAALCTDPKTRIATLIKRIENTDDLFSASVIKVVRSSENRALYFSRNAVPYIKGVEKDRWLAEGRFYKHIGIYAYRAEVLNTIAKLRPTPLEMSEGLEQLRWMENGYHIQLAETEHESNSVDTQEDLQRLLESGLPNS